VLNNLKYQSGDLTKLNGKCCGQPRFRRTRKWPKLATDSKEDEGVQGGVEFRVRTRKTRVSVQRTMQTRWSPVAEEAGGPAGTCAASSSSKHGEDE
jgi:hypothetical protein